MLSGALLDVRAVLGVLVPWGWDCHYLGSGSVSALANGRASDGPARLISRNNWYAVAIAAAEPKPVAVCKNATCGIRGFGTVLVSPWPQEGGCTVLGLELAWAGGTTVTLSRPGVAVRLSCRVLFIHDSRGVIPIVPLWPGLSVRDPPELARQHVCLYPDKRGRG